MHKPSTRVIIREAREDDRNAVFQFCKNTFSWGDYIPTVWSRWLGDPRGKTLVATVNNTPVGLMNVLLSKPGEAWLRAARTHPDYRGQGIATLLSKACLSFARENNAKVARLITDSDNLAAQRVLEKLGFKQVSVFVSLECNTLDAPQSHKSRWADANDEEKVWRFLRRSECFKKSAGLYTVLYTWYSLDKQDLHSFLTARHAIVHEKGGVVDGLTLVDEGPKKEWQENAVQTCYVDGDYDSSVDMLRLLKSDCRETGTAAIYGLACEYAPVVKALKSENFNTSNHAEMVYEKRLTP